MTEELKTIQKEAKLKGKYIGAIGRRKSSTARLRMYKKGNGVFMINGVKMSEYLTENQANILKQALKTTGLLRELNFSVITNGGGKKGQTEAIRHAITRALIEMDETMKPALKAKGWTTRDSRIKERKKPGLKKARKSPQWSKR